MSYKILCDLEGHFDLWGQWQGNFIFILSLGSSFHNSVNYWPNFFNLSTWSLTKEHSGCRAITSSLYLNWNISVIYCRIEIKLVFVKAEWRWLLFRKKHFLCHFWSSKHDVIKLSIADISLIRRWIESQIGQRDLYSPYNLLVIKISCDLERHIDLWGQL